MATYDDFLEYLHHVDNTSKQEIKANSTKDEEICQLQNNLENSQKESQTI